MTVTNLFQVDIHKEVVAVVSVGHFQSLTQRFFNYRVDPEPRTCLQLRGGVRILINLMVASTVLCLGSWGGF